MEPVARIISRGKGVTGIVFPVGEGLPYGIYDVVEVLGEYQIRYSGVPANPQARQMGLDLDGLMIDRPNSAATIAEIALMTGIKP